MKTLSEENKARIESLTNLGFTLEVLGGAHGDVKDNWPSIKYAVRLSYKGKQVILTDYFMGIGHVELLKPQQIKGFSFLNFLADEKSMLCSWVNNPHAIFQDKQLQANVAAKLANTQKVAPTLADVIYSLFSDGEAFFRGMTFEQWASEFGYDVDSRKAETLYKACDDIGRKIANTVPREVINKAKEIMQDY